MTQYKVPQFIDIEDTVFGPFTFKQFIYLAGGAGLSFVLYKLLPLFLAIILILPTMGLALALTFYKINQKPFIFILQNYFKYLFQGKLYIWKKDSKVKKTTLPEKPKTENYIPTMSASKLKELSWGLDVLDVNKKEEQLPKSVI